MKINPKLDNLRPHAVVGLRNATKEEIDFLKNRYPQGYHATKYADGSPLRHNGVFYVTKPDRYRGKEDE